MPRSVLRRIGNSVGLTLPGSFVREKGLKPGDAVEVDVRKAKQAADMWGVLKRRGLTAERLNRLSNEGEELG